MGMLQRIMQGGLMAGTPGPTDDFWYRDTGTMTLAGVPINEDGAKKLSAWYRGRDLLATALAMLPLPVMQKLPNDRGAEKAKAHPLYDILHRKPNDWQNSFEWRRTGMYHLIDHGMAYDAIVDGRRGAVDQLRPIHPKLVTPEQLPSGRILYHVKKKDGQRDRTYTQDEIFVRRGASDDGITGKGILEWARDSLGTARATETYAARVFSKGVLNGGVISVTGLLDNEASKRMARSFVTSGDEWHMPKVLEQGATWAKDDGMTPEKAQMLLSRKFSIDDIARWLGVPPHMIGSLDRSTNNNIEQQSQEFVDYSLGPWLSLWEFAINDQLVLVPDKYFVEFTRDALVRGDIAARWQAYHVAVTDGVLARNEVRRKENLNALPGLDEPLTPAHIIGKQAQDEPPARRALPPARDEDEDEDDEAEGRAHAIVVASAERMLRKEIKAVSKSAVRCAADGDAFAAAVTDFYAAHVDLAMQTLMFSEERAKEYCAGQASQALTDWVNALALWETSAYARGVAELALENAA